MFEIGEKVRVSNGQPQPPAHHTRKLRAWQGRNFNGTVTEYRDSCPLYNGAPAVHVEHEANGLESLGIASFVSVVPAAWVSRASG